MNSNSKQSVGATDKERFVAFFPQVVKDLTDDGLQQKEVADAFIRLKEVRIYLFPVIPWNSHWGQK